MCQMCGTFCSSRYVCTPSLMLKSESLSPHETHSSFSCFLAAARSGTSCAGCGVLGADEKPPTHANVFRFARPKVQ